MLAWRHRDATAELRVGLPTGSERGWWRVSLDDGVERWALAEHRRRSLNAEHNVNGPDAQARHRASFLALAPELASQLRPGNCSSSSNGSVVRCRTGRCPPCALWRG